MADQVAVAVSGGGAVAVAGLTKFCSHPKRFLNQCLGLVVLEELFCHF